MKLTYFSGRGRAEPIRLMLAAGGIDYQDDRLTFEQWAKVKQDTPFGKLPLLELDDGTVLAESNAIGRLVAKRAGLYGDGGEEQAAQIDAVFGFTTDFVQSVVKLAYEKDEEKKKKLAEEINCETIPKFVEAAEKTLVKSGGKYFVGGKLSWADVFMFDTLRSLTDAGDPFYGRYMGNALGDARVRALDSAPVLKNLIRAVGEQPGIKNWLEKRPGNDEEIF